MQWLLVLIGFASAKKDPPKLSSLNEELRKLEAAGWNHHRLSRLTKFLTDNGCVSDSAKGYAVEDFSKQLTAFKEMQGN